MISYWLLITISYRPVKLSPPQIYMQIFFPRKASHYVESDAVINPPILTDIKINQRYQLTGQQTMVIIFAYMHSLHLLQVC